MRYLFVALIMFVVGSVQGQFTHLKDSLEKVNKEINLETNFIEDKINTNSLSEIEKTKMPSQDACST
jgi:hypothetical protein